MKRHPTITGTLALVVAVVFAYAATAQNTTTTQRHNAERTQANQFGKLDSMTQGSHFRASQVIGANIYNMNEESVGEIEDIVLDATTGKISYAAVTYGGFLGIGDSMFAVPWEAFQVKASRDDPDDHHLYLDVSQERLEGAQGFDQDNWPNFADQNWKRELDRRYGVDRRMEQRDGSYDNNRNRGVGVNVDRDGVDVDVDRDN